MEQNNKNSESHIHLTVEPESSGDSENSNEKYNDSNEKYLVDINQNCIRFSKYHTNLAKSYNRYNFVLSFIIHSIPLILINLTIFNEEHFKIIQCVFLTISVICNSFRSLKNYDKQILDHLNITKKYDDLADEINKVLIRKKKYRPPFPVILENINLKLLNLNELKSCN